jgi:hypothetical protein
MQIKDVEIHAGGIDRPYQVIAKIEAKVSAASVFATAPSLEDVNLELQKKAAEMYANAVIDVEYDRGMSLVSYRVLKASGTAVIAESDEVDCPFCAERIKRAAKKCKHCSSTL